MEVIAPFWPEGGVLTFPAEIVVAAVAAALLVQHLCHHRGFGAGLRFSGWMLGGAALLLVVLFSPGGVYEQSCAGSEGQQSCSRIELPTETFLDFGLFLLLLAAWSVLYATALAVSWLVYRLVVPGQRVGP